VLAICDLRAEIANNIDFYSTSRHLIIARRKPHPFSDSVPALFHLAQRQTGRVGIQLVGRIYFLLGDNFNDIKFNAHVLTVSPPHFVFPFPLGSHLIESASRF